MLKIIPTVNKYQIYSKYFNENYYDLSELVPDKSKVLIRPTFAFTMAKKQLKADYVFGILNVMKNQDMNFKQSVLFKNYDYLFLDENFLDQDLFIDNRNALDYNNPYYIQYKDVGSTKAEFLNLIDSGFLKQIGSFNEISHGITYIYKINN